jgi:hypothetical protein
MDMDVMIPSKHASILNTFAKAENQRLFTIVVVYNMVADLKQDIPKDNHSKKGHP